MKTERKCSNCHWWKLNGSEVLGDCECPLPVSMSGFLIRQKPMLEQGGKNCPAHRMRSSRKVAASHQAQVGEG